MIFQNSFVNSLASLGDAFGTVVQPTPLPMPRWIHRNPALAEELGIDWSDASPPWLEVLAGNALRPGMVPFSALYAGHQFGQWVPQLGDGRAILLGEWWRDGQRHEIQLKGAGITPYSRMGDGRAVLRSCIREYLASAAMEGLGIPTTRALAIVASPEPVYRERVESAAVLTRVAPSHIRFGSFEVFYYRQQFELLRRLADQVIELFYPDCRAAANPYAALLHQVVLRTADLLAHWQAVGFCHGVMNTDNMSILGLTLDYGPFGFLDGFNAHHICNHSDHGGRYAYDQQTGVAFWNLQALAEALSPLLRAAEAEAALDAFRPHLEQQYLARMRAKLGLTLTEPDDWPLITELLTLMHRSRADYTLLFRGLGEDPGAANNPGRGDAPTPDTSPPAALRDAFIDRNAFDAWYARYQQRLALEPVAPAERRQRMQAVNPKFILRNHLAELAIRAARDQGDLTLIDTLFQILQRPHDDWPEHDAYAAPPPDWAADLEISCSS